MFRCSKFSSNPWRKRRTLLENCLALGRSVDALFIFASAAYIFSCQVLSRSELPPPTVIAKKTEQQGAPPSDSGWHVTIFL